MKRDTIPCAAALVMVMLMTAAPAWAGKPSPLGFRLVWVHQRVISKVDATSPMCTGDAREHQAEAERFAASIDKALARGEKERANVPARDAEHPDVVAAIAHMEALDACRKHIRASLAGEADVEADDPAPEPEDVAAEASPVEDQPEAAAAPILTEQAASAPPTEAGFVGALTPEARQEMALLVTFDPAAPAGLPADARGLRRIVDVAEAVWPLCTGSFAGLIMGGAADGARAPDADPWRWCQAAAARVDKAKGMGEAMVARSLVVLRAAEQRLSGVAGDAKAEVERAAAKVQESADRAKGELTDAKLAAESEVANTVLTIRDELAEAELIGNLVGLEASAEVDAAMARAKGLYTRYESVVTEVIDKLAHQASDAARAATGRVGAEAKKLLQRVLKSGKRSVDKSLKAR